MRRKIFYLCINFFWFFFFSLAVSSFGQGSEVLVRIDLMQPRELDKLQGEPIKICLRTDAFLLGTVASDELARLDRLSLSYEVVDTQPWTEPYYFIISPTPELAKNLPLTVKVLHESADQAVVKISDTQAFELAKKGFQLARIFDQALPATVPAAPQFQKLESIAAQDTLIPKLLKAVSDSSVRSFLQRLQDFRTRYSFSDSIIPARNWLTKKFREFGYTDVRLDPFNLNSSTQSNVVATKPGTFGTDRVIIVGGHYDSIVLDGTNPRVFAPGVDDNGSGTAGTLEIARVLAGTALETTVLFIPFAGEEQGLWGSSHFAETAYNNGMNIALVLNMDMIANVSDNVPDLNVLTDSRSQGFAQLVSQLTNKFTGLLPQIGSSGGGSDHFPFQQFGFPALFIHEGDFSPHWHRATDVIGNVSVPYATEVVKVVLAAAVTVANSPATPTGFTALELGDGHSQLLIWKHQPEPDFAGYRIYVGTSPGAYRMISTVSTPFDTLRNLVENETLYAAVSAFDRDGNESLLTPEITFTPRKAPLAPAGLDATSKRTAIALTWQANNVELDLAGYNIYRSLTPNGTFEWQAFVSAPQTHWIDQAVQPHTFYYSQIKAIDKTQNESPASGVVKGRLATHDAGILIVDNSLDGNGGLLRPRDGDVDEFYRNLLSGFKIAGEWDMADSLAKSNALTDADLGIYSTIVWHAEVRLGRSFKEDTTTLRKYLAQGGNLWLVGWSLLRFMGVQAGEAHVFDNGTFIHDDLKIRSARVSTDRDFAEARSLRPGYPSFKVDSLKVPTFGGNLLEIDAFLPPLVEEPITEAIYEYVSSQGSASPNHQKPVALRYLGKPYKVVVFDFPLYFMESSNASQAAQQVMRDLGELPVGVREAATLDRLPTHFALHQNHPNPFNAETVIRYEIPSGMGNAPVRICIYNLQGQFIKTLVDEKKSAGMFAVRWNGTNEQGRHIPSGVYFYQMTVGNFRSARKLLILN